MGAGITEAFVVVPFELVKIRMQARENVGRYANSMDAVVKIAKQEGVMTFYKGLESTLWRNGVWNAAYFGTIHRLKEAIPVASDKPGLTSARDFGAGVVAGTLATSLNTPFDVAKSTVKVDKCKLESIAECLPLYVRNSGGRCVVFVVYLDAERGRGTLKADVSSWKWIHCKEPTRRNAAAACAEK